VTNRSRILLGAVAVGLMLAACADGEEPSTDGTLVVSTSTGGGAPDPDGYWLTVDALDSLPLDPTGIAELALPSGRHSLRLHGVAQHCSVNQETSLEVNVPSRGTVAVAFEVSCPAGAIRVTTTTTGLDPDPDGYRVVIDGADHGSIPANGTRLTGVEPGTRTITLTGLAPLCASEGPDSRAVTVTGPEPVSIEFAIVCTAASGVIGVVVETSGPHTSAFFEVMIDARGAHYVGWGGPHYVADVSGGQHVVSLRPASSCAMENDQREVTIAVGELIRDTVEVSFSVTCAQEPEPSGTVRITAPTTGTTATPYRVWYEHFDAWGYGGVVNHLGELEPNGTLLVDLPVSNTWSGGDPYWYRFYLEDAPSTCRADDPNPSQGGFTIEDGDTLEVEFTVRCSP
jgi:hypothetical protein